MPDDPFMDPPTIEQELISLGAEKVVVLGADGNPDTTKQGDGCAAGEVWMIVDRFGPSASGGGGFGGGTGGMPVAMAQVTAVNDADIGLDPARLNITGKTKLRLPYPSSRSTDKRDFVVSLPQDGRRVDSAGLTRLDLH